MPYMEVGDMFVPYMEVSFPLASNDEIIRRSYLSLFTIVTLLLFPARSSKAWALM